MKNYRKSMKNSGAELSKHEEKKQELSARRDRFKVFIHNLGNLNEPIFESDEKLCYVVVDSAVVHASGGNTLKEQNAEYARCKKGATIALNF